MSERPLEMRVVELELRALEQERLLEELSQVIYAQDRTLKTLGNELERLRQKVVEPGVVDAKQHDKPPHY